MAGREGPAEKAAIGKTMALVMEEPATIALFGIGLAGLGFMG